MNQISLIAFIIVLGILVDNSIVVNENIERRMLLGEKISEAAVNGPKEVFSSVVTSTIIIVFTFLPLMFLSGAAGGFIRPLPAIIISSIIASALVALFLIPIYVQVIGTKRAFSEGGRIIRQGYLGKALDSLANYQIIS
ncbi:MAG: efflux RND transporter permease subunit [Bacillota bacterium]